MNTRLSAELSIASGQHSVYTGMEGVASGPCHLQILRGVPPAMSAGAIPSVPTLPSALRPQESGQGHPRREAALILQGTLSGLQQEGTGPARVSSGWGGDGGSGWGSFPQRVSLSPGGTGCMGSHLFLLNYICCSVKPAARPSQLQGSDAVKAA